VAHNKRLLTDDDLLNINEVVKEVVEPVVKEVVDDAVDDALADIDVEEIIREGIGIKWQLIT
jgi:hypothetical protein